MSPIKNVIFIMLDTLQFNYLGAMATRTSKRPIWIVLPDKGSCSRTPIAKGSLPFPSAGRSRPALHFALCRVEAAGSE